MLLARAEVHGSSRSAAVVMRLCPAIRQARSAARSPVMIRCSSHGGKGSGGKGRKGMGQQRARHPGQFEVRVITPPVKSLGIHLLPPLTHNGEEITVEGNGYVVKSVEMQFTLRGGRYVKEHTRLDVVSTGRYFLDLQLNDLLTKS